MSDIYDNGKLQAIRNKDGLFINTECFREEAKHFSKYGYYCPDRPGTRSYNEYWEEQQTRCVEGYSSGGVSIAGHHYAYLNFYPIMKLDAKGNTKGASKVRDMPDFWDGDYNYFWTKEIAFKGIENCNFVSNDIVLEEFWKLGEEDQIRERVRIYNTLGLECVIKKDHLDGGYHMIVGKSRRKGYSFKNAAVLANTYSHYRESLSIAGAFLKEYLFPKGLMSMANKYLDHLIEHTAFGKTRDYINQTAHKKASYKEYINGNPIEKGFQSEIIALSFNDNPDAARGKDAKEVLFEEAGKFPNLKKSYMATKPALEAGSYTTGQMTIFGTGGDMEKGTKDFADMFYNPEEYGLLPFENIWDKNSQGTTCGFFHSVVMNMEGYYDEHGNSDKKGARKYQEKLRANIIKNSSDSQSINLHNQEWPYMPSEAFLMVSYNDFPVVELRNHYNKVKRENLHTVKGQPVELYKKDGKVKCEVDLKNLLNPIWEMKPSTNDKKGAVVIYEYPIEGVEKGAYKMGYDPYRQDQGSSLGCVYVYKCNIKGSYNSNTIVAMYVGRPKTSDDFNRQVEMLAELYNCEVMYENEVPTVKSYFEKRNKLRLLALQPDAVISKNIKKSKVARVYGCHMNDRLKDAGEKYIKRWLLEEVDYDENGDTILRLETIYDLGLLEELINYNRKGNFDRVMAFMMVMLFLEEEDLNKEYKDRTEKQTELTDFLSNMYKR